MNMSTHKSLDMHNVITPEEYSKIIEKENLTPKELIQKEQYERYIDYVKDLDSIGLAPTSSEPVMAEQNTRVARLMEKESKTSHEEEVLNNWKNDLEEVKVQTFSKNRQLKKAGHADIFILLYAILNIGFIIAMAMLKK